MNKLECGHPKDCFVPDPYEDEEEGEGEGSCEWCDMIKGFRSQNKTLLDQLKKTAIVLAPGTHDLTTKDIGLFYIDGGTVNIKHCAPQGEFPNTCVNKGDVNVMFPGGDVSAPVAEATKETD